MQWYSESDHWIQRRQETEAWSIRETKREKQRQLYSSSTGVDLIRNCSLHWKTIFMATEHKLCSACLLMIIIMIVADCVKSMKFQLNDNKTSYVLSFTQNEKIEILIPRSLVDMLLTKPKTSKQNFCSIPHKHSWKQPHLALSFFRGHCHFCTYNSNEMWIILMPSSVCLEHWCCHV